MTVATHNMVHCLCAEKASGRSFCSPYGPIVLIIPYNAPLPPLQSMLQALLVEDRLLVSQRQAGHPWTQKCVRCGAPTRVARSIPLLASWRNGNYSFSIREVILFPSRMFWRKKRGKKIKKLKVFSRLVIRKNNWAFWNLLMLVWMDYNGHPIYCHFGFFFPKSFDVSLWGAWI